MAAQHYSWRDAAAPTLALFTSAGTLVCCALPALLVTLGLGASLAGFVTAFPQIVWLSEHKGAVFGVSGAMLLAASFLQWRARSLPCPVDPIQARACARIRRISVGLLGFAVLIWGVGAFFAFVAARLLFES